MILEEFQRRRYWENAVFLYIIKAENIEQGVKKILANTNYLLNYLNSFRPQSSTDR
jgi:hypothetical protein